MLAGLPRQVDGLLEGCFQLIRIGSLLVAKPGLEGVVLLIDRLCQLVVAFLLLPQFNPERFHDPLHLCQRRAGGGVVGQGAGAEHVFFY